MKDPVSDVLFVALHSDLFSIGLFSIVYFIYEIELHTVSLSFPSEDIRMKNEGEATERPDNTAFTQQRLPAWQPILSAGIIIPGFLIIGLAFIGIGIGLFLTSQTIQVLEVSVYCGTTTEKNFTGWMTWHFTVEFVHPLVK